jgi:tetratricopeptide (TPR) repeat protein
MLINLVSEFEMMIESDSLGYLDEKDYFQIINYYEKNFLIEKAIEVVDYAIEQYSYRSEFLITKARLLIIIEQHQEAIEVLDYAEVISPFENDIQLYRVRALTGIGMTKEAKEILDGMSQFVGKTEVADIYLAESYIYEKEKDFSKMYDVLKDALVIDPNHPECLERIWISVELSRRYFESISLHKNLVDKKPYNALAWYNLGQSYASVGEYEKAIEAIEYAFIINKDMEIAYIECAELCSLIKKHDKALSIYEEANSYFGPDSELLVCISICQIELNNFLSAKASLFTALSLDPYNEEIYFYLGECYVKEKNWHSAINAYSKAISIEDGREEFHGSIAMTYIQLGRYDKAIEHLTMACSIAPEDPKYWFQYACLLIKSKKYNEAIELLDEAEEESFDPTLLYARAACLNFLGEKKEALKILDEVLLDSFELHNSLFEIDPQLKFDKEILSIINYYEGEVG